jgi:hypothetical protein
MIKTAARICNIIVCWFRGCGMVLNAIFNNILVIMLRSVLMVEETGVNHRPAANHWQTLLHNLVSSTLLHGWDSNQLLWSFSRFDNNKFSFVENQTNLLFYWKTGVKKKNYV